MHEKERSCVILRYGHKDMQYMHARDEEGGVNIVVKYARKLWCWGGIRCRCHPLEGHSCGGVIFGKRMSCLS